MDSTVEILPLAEWPSAFQHWYCKGQSAHTKQHLNLSETDDQDKQLNNKEGAA